MRRNTLIKEKGYSRLLRVNTRATTTVESLGLGQALFQHRHVELHRAVVNSVLARLRPHRPRPTRDRMHVRSLHVPSSMLLAIAPPSRPVRNSMAMENLMAR
jgi:hypothetical protein